ncbi:MAG: 30S ribosomal protein S20 [Dehalococcoidia bacterium]|nr:MAG: 30S ribosomal protein S20 [Dehalococcoidia bacterium]
MANTKSAKKSIRVIKERRSRNRSVNSDLKTSIAKAEKLILSKELEPAKEAVMKATIALDKAVKKGVIHSNNAARRKSSLMKKFNLAFSSES